MKISFTLLTGFACFMFFSLTDVNAQWSTLGENIYNTNAGNVGIGTSAPSFKLDVQRFGNAQIQIHNNGGNAGATFSMVDDLSGADWAFKATTYGGFKIRDISNALDVMVFEPNSAVNRIYVTTDGNVGVGLAAPLEQLHVNGAITLGNTATNNAGTIKWDGNNFKGYSGSSWKTLDASSLAVGDLYGGGVIFWLDPSGSHGLVVALDDQSPALQWYNGAYVTTSTTTSAIYAGEIQTAIIVYLQGAGSYAAQACNDYDPVLDNVFYGDWYLPTRYEINTLYQNRAVVNATAVANGGTALASDTYWTCNEYSDTNAWIFHFDSGTFGHTGKIATLHVRAIREF